ncbi:hypothetical protein [Desertivirga brevis]|uniref:hypothetical protein n=1 Tax=Desertivirga brevis TaxID=2810310 RepID=UPI001A96DA21|nr:hypothetical protein [Pedobacter sp. SYSU D00873]
MEQKNQGKISIQQEEKQGDQLVYGPILGEREYLYFSEAKESLESLTWEDAEQICNRKLLPDPSILTKAWRRDESGDWQPHDERVLLLFDDK